MSGARRPLSQLFHYPVNIHLLVFHAEVYPNFCHRLGGHGEARGIVVEVDLAHCGGGVLVELQFKDVKPGVGEHHDVHTAVGRVHLHVDKEIRVTCKSVWIDILNLSSFRF